MATPNNRSALSDMVQLNIMRDLMREGRCHLCGIHTHRVVTGPDGNERKEELIIDGEVHRGRCLFCFPFAEGQGVTPAAVAPATASVRTADGGLRGAAAIGDARASRRGSGDFARAVAREHSWQKADTDDDADVESRAPPSSVRRVGSMKGPTDTSRTVSPDRRNEQEEAVTPSPLRIGSEGTCSETEIKDQMTPSRSKRKGAEENAATKKHKSKHGASSIDPIVNDIRRTIAEASANKLAQGKLEKLIEHLRRIVEDRPTYANAVIANGGVEIIVDALKKHNEGSKKKAMFPYECCLTIAHLAYKGDDLRIASAGAIPVLVRTMKVHRSNGKIGTAAVEALVNLSTRPSLRDEVVNTGGLEAIISAMHAKAKNAILQQRGCEVIQNLASCFRDASSSSGATHYAHEVAGVGGINAVLGAMQNHPENTGVQLCACNALANLAACGDEIRSRIVAENGIDTILAPTMNLILDGDIQESVCDALQSLAADQDLIQVEVTSAGGATKIVAIMKEHTEDSGLLVKACGILETLARNKKCVASVAQAGAKDLIERMIERHNDSEEVQESGRAVLRCIKGLDLEA